MNSTVYATPPCLTNSSGSLRRVGFELEFAGIPLKTAADVVRDTLGGEIDFNSQAECQIETDALGRFIVEVDNEFTKRSARKRAEKLDLDPEKSREDDALGEMLVGVVTKLVPVEVVCPPIGIGEIEALDYMVAALRDAGALGTDDSLVYAFGLHINPELPECDSRTISRHLKAFCIAQDWLLSKNSVDLVRRITPYINLYPDAYIERVLHYPDDVLVEELMDDYLRYNRTRNRALDMLPLFRFMNEDKICAVLDDSRIKSRPTFHYRLPNCEIDKPDWNLSHGWNLWCTVEQLASEPDLLDKLSGEWLEYNKKLTELTEKPWWKEMDALLGDLLSA